MSRLADELALMAQGRDPGRAQSDVLTDASAACAQRDELLAALRLFVGCIDATGGVITDGKGYTVPAADEDWIDLGDAYTVAVAAIAKAGAASEPEPTKYGITWGNDASSVCQTGYVYATIEAARAAALAGPTEAQKQRIQVDGMCDASADQTVLYGVIQDESDDVETVTLTPPQVWA